MTGQLDLDVERLRDYIRAWRDCGGEGRDAQLEAADIPLLEELIDNWHTFREATAAMEQSRDRYEESRDEMMAKAKEVEEAANQIRYEREIMERLGDRIARLVGVRSWMELQLVLPSIERQLDKQIEENSNG